jgi:DNA polymerase-1
VQVAGTLLAPEEGTPTFAKLRARYLPSSLAVAEGESREDRAADEAAATLSLGKELERLLGEAGLLEVFRGLDMPLLPVLHRMEERGIRIDPEIFRELSARLAREVEDIERKVAAAAGTEFNINSPKQLAFLLFEKLGLPPVKKTKTGYSTDVEVLEQLKNLHEVPSLVLENAPWRRSAPPTSTCSRWSTRATGPIPPPSTRRRPPPGGSPPPTPTCKHPDSQGLASGSGPASSRTREHLVGADYSQVELGSWPTSPGRRACPPVPLGDDTTPPPPPPSSCRRPW